MTTRIKNPVRVIIIGGGLGGLSVAIHLRLAGCHVILYEANDQVGGRASQLNFEGFSFDTGPTLLNYPWVFDDLFKAAGRRLADAVELLPVDPSITFLWPDGKTFSLSSHLRRLIAEVERISPGSAPGLIGFLADASNKFSIAFDKLACRNANSITGWLRGVSPVQLWRTGVWRSLDAELARFLPHPCLRQALGSYGMYLGGSPHQLPGLFSILPYGELAYGLWLPRGGIAGLVRAIETLALDLGVEINTSCPVHRIVVNGSRAEGIELEDGRHVSGGCIVSNVDVPWTRRRLLGVMPKRGRELKMTPAVLTFYWGVKGKVDGAGHHSIFLPDDPRASYTALFKLGRIPRELPFYISVASATDPELAPSGDSSLFVLVPLPRLSQLDGWNDDSLCDHIRQRVIERMRMHGIAFDENRIVAERTMTPADWSSRFSLYDGSAFGASHNLFQMGPMRYPNRDRKIRGLYYVGASTTPGTGLPMVTLSGKMTAERILDDIH